MGEVRVVDVVSFGHVTAIYLFVCERTAEGLAVRKCVAVVTFPAEPVWMQTRGLRFLIEKAGHGAVPSERCVEAIVQAEAGHELPPEIAQAAVKLPPLDPERARIWAGLSTVKPGRVSVA